MLFSPNFGFSDLIFSSVFSSKAAKSRFLPFYFRPNHQFFALCKTNFSKQKPTFLNIFNHKKHKTTSHCKYTTIHVRRNMQHLACVLQELALRLARVSIAFSTSQHCIQHELALHLARVSIAFYCKQPTFSPKQQFFTPKTHYSLLTRNSLFAVRQTFVRIDFLRTSERLLEKKALIMLNFLLFILQLPQIRKRQAPNKQQHKTLLGHLHAPWSNDSDVWHLTISLP